MNPPAEALAFNKCKTSTKPHLPSEMHRDLETELFGRDESVKTPPPSSSNEHALLEEDKRLSSSKDSQSLSGNEEDSPIPFQDPQEDTETGSSLPDTILEVLSDLSLIQDLNTTDQNMEEAHSILSNTHECFRSSSRRNCSDFDL